MEVVVGSAPPKPKPDTAGAAEVFEMRGAPFPQRCLSPSLGTTGEPAAVVLGVGCLCPGEPERGVVPPRRGLCPKPGQGVVCPRGPTMTDRGLPGSPGGWEKIF